MDYSYFQVTWVLPSAPLVVALPESVNQGKGGKRDAFLPGTGSSGRDAMGVRYTVASVTTIGLESAIYFGTFYLSILRHHKGGGIGDGGGSLW